MLKLNILYRGNRMNSVLVAMMFVISPVDGVFDSGTNKVENLNQNVKKELVGTRRGIRIDSKNEQLTPEVIGKRRGIRI